MADTPFKRILVGTLGSPWSQRALELAVNMAKAYQIEFVVLAVLTPAYVPEKRRHLALEPYPGRMKICGNSRRECSKKPRR